jgi:cell division protein FtsA
VSIPGLRGRDPKEISLKNLSKVIHARVVEIIEQVYLEIRNYGHEEQKKKLIAGIVLTGGGSQLRHLKQLVEYITGMDTRIGYPNEHLAGDSDSETTSPMYATAVGLVLTNLNKKNRTHASARPKEIDVDLDFTSSDQENEEVSAETEAQDSVNQRGFFDKWADKFKEFLDNAE